MIRYPNRFEDAVVPWRNTPQSESISNAQPASLPRNENASGNELKQSVTKRKTTTFRPADSCTDA
ncbi:hypothetical protein C5O79_34350 [Burkholderia sp. SRS-25]|nr:hypothetical protein C5O79_34350 [Burkholderia sp. SRS-25]